MLGGDVTGRTLGLIGPGPDRRGRGRAGPRVPDALLYHGRRPSPALDALGGRGVASTTLLAESDFVSLHVPLTAETRHLIDARRPGPDEADGLPDQHGAGPGGRRGGPGRGAARPAGSPARASTSTRTSRGWPPGWPIARTPSSCPTWAAPPTRPARPCRGSAAENLVAVLEGAARPTWSTPRSGRGGRHRRRAGVDRFRLENAARFRRCCSEAIGSSIPSERRSSRARSHGRAQVSTDVARPGEPAPRAPQGVRHRPRPDPQPPRHRVPPGPDDLPPRHQRERPAVRPLAGRGVRHADRRHRHPGRAARALSPGRRARPGQAQRACATSSPTGGRWACASPPSSTRMLAEAHRAFVKAATAGDDPEEAYAAAQASLAAAWTAGNLMVEAYTAQVLQTRLAGTPKLPTSLGCMLDGDPKLAPWARRLAGGVQRGAGLLPLDAPGPGRRGSTAGSRSTPSSPGAAGTSSRSRPARCSTSARRPARLDLALGGRLRHDPRPGRRPRPPGRHPLPGQGPRLAPGPPPGLRRLPRPLRGGADPDRRPRHPGRPPGRPRGPVHHRRRAPLGRVDGLQPVPARPAPPGRLPRPRRPRPRRRSSSRSPRATRPPAATSATSSTSRRLLDLYALLNLPLHIWFAFPSSAEPDPQADPTVRVEAAQWPAPPDETTQAAWAAKWIALAVAKPFVRSVTWLQPSDADPHLYPHAGLFRARPDAQAPRRLDQVVPPRDPRLNDHPSSPISTLKFPAGLYGFLAFCRPAHSEKYPGRIHFRLLRMSWPR